MITGTVSNPDAKLGISDARDTAACIDERGKVNACRAADACSGPALATYLR